MSRFLRICSQSSKKVQIWPKKNFFWKNRKRCQKTQNFTLISNPLKKLLKNAHKKVISKISLTNMSKSEKSAYFRHIFANNFFVCIFQTFFNGFEISVKFFVFWYPYWIVFLCYRYVLCVWCGVGWGGVGWGGGGAGRYKFWLICTCYVGNYFHAKII